jgi:hypothetical protein
MVVGIVVGFVVMVVDGFVGLVVGVFGGVSYFVFGGVGGGIDAEFDVWLVVGLVIWMVGLLIRLI